MKFKKGEYVLVSNGNGGYSVKQVTSINNGKYLLAYGYFVFEYDEKNIHKCPKSISDVFVKKFIESSRREE